MKPKNFTAILLFSLPFSPFFLVHAGSFGIGVGAKGGLANYEDGGSGSTFGIHLEVWAFKHLSLEVSGDQWQKEKEPKFWFDRSFSFNIKGFIYPCQTIPLIIYPGLGISTDKMWKTMQDPNIGKWTSPNATGGPHIFVGTEYTLLPHVNVMFRIERRWLVGGDFFYPTATYLYGGIVFTNSSKRL